MTRTDAEKFKTPSYFPPNLETFAAIHNSVATQELISLYISYPIVHRGHHWTAVSPYFIFETIPEMLVYSIRHVLMCFSFIHYVTS